MATTTRAANGVAPAVDPLTGLANRDAALTFLTEALRFGRTDLAVLFCDLDRFKAINDTMGHAAGDEVLVQVADRLRAAVAQTDLVARLGGDEFVIVCTQVVGQDDAQRRARRVLDCFAADFNVAGVDCQTGVSVGMALPDGSDAMHLIWNADIAMYAAKRNRTGVALFTPSLNEENRRRQQLERDLRRAVSRGEMSLVFQPLIAPGTGYVEGVEALLRWQHPTGPISPAVFVPMAERIGVIDQIGRFAMVTALGHLRVWHATNPDAAPRFVAVNVAAAQLADPTFPDTVRTVLETAGVPAHALTVEITESALIGDDAPQVVADLAGLGVTVDIDDFGTGYSSLAYLVRLPVHALKIDKSFVWGLEEDARLQTTVRAIVRLAHDLGLSCVAEGVETPEQQAWLTGAGCDLLQGFGISRPLPAAEVLPLCVARRC